MKYKTHYTIRTRNSEGHNYWTGLGWSPLAGEAKNFTRAKVWSAYGKATASLMEGETIGPDIEVLKYFYHPDSLRLPNEEYTIIFRGTYVID